MNKILLIIGLLMLSFTAYSQVNVSITNMQYINGTAISNCGTIDFGASSNVRVQFTISLSKQSNQAVGISNLYVYTIGWSGSRIERKNEIVQPVSFDTNYQSSADITMNASDFNISGGVLFAVFKSSSGVEYLSTCDYSLIKTPVPTFSLSPTTLTLPCGDTSSKTFTVTPSNIPSGANVTYQWSHPGWNSVSSTSNSRTLQPSSGSSLPSTVTVTPFVNGVAKPSMSCSVSRAAFSSIATISGNNYVCDTGTYTINSLPSNATVQSVSSSNTSIATVNFIGNNQFSVTKISDGLVTITATLQNSCSQTTTISKEIQIGVSNAINSASISGDLYICSNQNYTYTVYGASHPCITSYNWVVSPNLHIISQDANSITVSHNQSNNEYAGNIKYTIPGSSVEVSKGVWVGVPVSEGLNIQKIGSYDFYAGSWTKLMATYITLMYEANGTYDLTYEWQIPNSMVRSFADTAYKDVNPRSSGQMNIGVRAWNECGCSEWKYKLFNVMGTGGGGPIELIPAN